MSRTSQHFGLIAFALVAALAGCALQGQQAGNVSLSSDRPTRVYGPALTPTPRARSVPSPLASQEGLRRLTILHTNDSRGYVDPCG